MGSGRLKFESLWSVSQTALLKGCSDFLLTSEGWQVALGPLPGHSYHPVIRLSTKAGGLAARSVLQAYREQPEGQGQEDPGNGTNSSLGGFFSRFGRALMLEMGAERPPPFVWLLPAACQGVLTLWAKTLCLVKQAFPVGTAVLGQHWPPS